MALYHLECSRRGLFLKAKSLTHVEERDLGVEAPVVVLRIYSATILRDKRGTYKRTCVVFSREEST
jgi:hypothetical protein